MSTTYNTLLETLPFWDKLNAEEQQQIINRKAVLTYQPGQSIQGNTMNCLGLVLVVKGVLRAYLLSPDGRAVTLYRIREGEACFMAAACALNAVSFETQVEAETASEVLLVPVDVFTSLIRNNIYVECASYRMATERFSDVVAGVERLVFLNLEQRLVSFLLDESAQSGSGEILMTHEQLAVNIGSAREAVSRTLKHLVTQGFLELFRGGVRLLDKPALYRLLEQNDS